MVTYPYEMMQRAVDIVNTSPHPTNKIAAALAGHDAGGHPYIITHTNYWPPAIERAFGRDGRIGNSSGTIHAETACILHAGYTRGAEMFITDPPCPNCAKNMAEAGIKALYIDHKGFDKDFAQRRGEEFQSMSMRILEAAGIPVYILHRKEQRMETVLAIPDTYVPPLENPTHRIALADAPSPAMFTHEIATAAAGIHAGRNFALALAQRPDKTWTHFSASSHPAIGYTHDDDLSQEGKYSFILQPLNRLLMAGKFFGLTIHPDYIYTSRTPTARELINLTGSGFCTLYVGNDDDARDENGLIARKQLAEAGLVNFLNIST